MKRYVKALVATCLLVCSGVAYSLPWSLMTQWQKNTALVSYATSYSNGTYGGQCKVWANTVVRTVSGKSLPATAAAPYDYQWLASSSVVQRYVKPSQFQPGDIIQMKLLSNGIPHTAIVVAVYPAAPGYIAWIDSNWYGYLGSSYVEKVYQHTISFATFTQKVGTQYSVYNVK